MNEVVLRYGNTDLNIYDGYDLTKSSQEVTYSDLTCEFTGHSADELPERYQEVGIIEKQKANQEIEVVNYEEIKETNNATFNSEIEENLIINKVYGKTEQETRIGKNLFNLNYIEQSTSKVVTNTGVNLKNCWGTQAFNNEKVLKTFKPNTTYTMKAKAKVVSRPSTQGAHQTATLLLYRGGASALGLVGVDLIKMKDKETIALNTEKEYITTFTTPADLSELRILTYSFYGNNDGSTTYAPSGEIDLTDIMLVEGTYTAETFPEYEQYGAMPSPEFPSKIKNVGDNINIFNKNANAVTSGISKTVLDTGVRITQTQAGNYKYGAFKIGEDNLLGKKLVLSAKMQASANNQPRAVFYFGSPTSAAVKQIGSELVMSGSMTINIPNSFPDGCDRIYLLLYSNKAGTGNVGDYVDYTDLKLEVGDKPTPYSNYNSGSVYLKQSGKNKLNVTAASKTFTEGITVTVNEDKSITINGTNNSSNTLYFRLADNFVLPAGSYTLSNENSNVSNNNFIFYDDNNKFPRKNISNATFTEDVTIKPYIKILYGATVNNQTIYPMIVEGDYSETTLPAYEPYQEQTKIFPLAEGQKLMKGDYLADDGIHHKKKQIVLDGVTKGLKVKSVTKYINDIYYCTVDLVEPSINGIINLYCTHFKAATGVQLGHCYITGYGWTIVFVLPDQTIATVEAANDFLKQQKEAGTPVIVEYELLNEIIEPYTLEQQKAWKDIQKIISYKGENHLNASANIDFKFPIKIKKEIVPRIYEKLLYTGYIEDYSFNEMREKDVDIDINITLYSPMKMTTLRTATAVGTYKLKSLIQKEILSPLIDDGFSIEELDITDRQLTVNYISETIEYCMNNLSNKFNFWWFIDEQKRIYIKDIDKLMNGEPDYIYDDTHSIAGLQYIKPITESDNYANVVNFKNVRIYEYSRLQLNGNTITQEHNPLISQQITTIKNGEQLDFNFPCDIKKENIIKSAESNGITQYFYGIYVKGTYSDNTTFEFSIGYDDINKTFETTDNVGFDGSENATEEFLLIRDSFFSNLITGFKLNNENKSIKSIEKITSDSALIWNVNKLYNDKAIADKRGIISKTGIVETTIDMNESWKTIQELREIGVSYMNKNSLDLNGTIELCTDRNVFQIGKTIYINKMLVNGTYIITQIKESVSNNDVDYYITAKNANMLDNYIDVFRGEASQESSDKTYQVYITHYEEENMYERHEVVQ